MTAVANDQNAELFYRSMGFAKINSGYPVQMFFEMRNYSPSPKIKRKENFHSTLELKVEKELPRLYSNGKFNLFSKSEKIGCLEYEKDDEDENVLKIVMLDMHKDYRHNIYLNQLFDAFEEKTKDLEPTNPLVLELMTLLD
uniref:Uncharacterized protein n=1 Tax=Ditylenchus dipsaci TaxID=166011 RepID=A0A915E287_9BILA